MMGEEWERRIPCEMSGLATETSDQVPPCRSCGPAEWLNLMKDGVAHLLA